MQANGMPPGCARRIGVVAGLSLFLALAGAGVASAQQDCGEALVCTGDVAPVSDVADVTDNQVGPVLDRVLDDVVGEIGEFRLF